MPIAVLLQSSTDISDFTGTPYEGLVELSVLSWEITGHSDALYACVIHLSLDTHCMAPVSILLEMEYCMSYIV